MAPGGICRSDGRTMQCGIREDDPRGSASSSLKAMLGSNKKRIVCFADYQTIQSVNGNRVLKTLQIEA